MESSAGSFETGAAFMAAAAAFSFSALICSSVLALGGGAAFWSLELAQGHPSGEALEFAGCYELECLLDWTTSS